MQVIIYKFVDGTTNEIEVTDELYLIHLELVQMEKQIPLGISIIYFNDKSKNIYAKLPPDKEQAKKLSKRIYKNAMTALASRELLAPCN